MAKLFSIVLFMCAVLAVLGLLAGCGGTGQGKISTNLGDASMQTTGKNRNDAWADVEGKKGDVVKDLEATKRKEIDLEIAKASQVQVVLDTPEKISAWNNAQVTRDLGEVAKNLSKGNTPSPYAEYFRPTPFPKNVVSEVIDSTGEAAEKVGRTPAGMLGTTAYALGQFNSGVRGGTTVQADRGANVEINQATADNKSKATAGGGNESADDTSKIKPEALTDCQTTANGPATTDEINACLVRDYGYDTYIEDGHVYYNGEPI